MLKCTVLALTIMVGSFTETGFVVQMGVKRIVLEAAYQKSLDVWTSRSMGFSTVKPHDFMQLKTQYTLVQSSGVAGRCMKLLPPPAALIEQVSLMDASCPLCCAHLSQYISPVLQQLDMLPSTTTPSTVS